MHAKRVFFFFARFTVIKCRPQKRSKRFILTNNKMKTYRQGLDFSCIIEMCKNIWFLFFVIQLSTASVNQFESLLCFQRCDLTE